MIIRELPTEERPREKLISLGSSVVSNAELLAILIGTGTKDRSALDLAASLLAAEEDGLGNLAGSTPEEICRISGMGIAKACRIIAAFELGRRLATRPLSEMLPRVGAVIETRIDPVSGQPALKSGAVSIRPFAAAFHSGRKNASAFGKS